MKTREDLIECYNASKIGDLDTIKKHMPKLNNRKEFIWNLEKVWDVITEEACKNGQLAIFQWLHVNGYPKHTGICSMAAKHNQLEILKWAIENGYHYDYWTCYCAAKNNHDKIDEWLKESGNCYCDGELH